MLKSNEIKELFQRFEEAAVEYNGVECWSARELQPLLGYSQWRRFTNAIEKAKEACANAGGNVAGLKLQSPCRSNAQGLSFREFIVIDLQLNR